MKKLRIEIVKKVTLSLVFFLFVGTISAQTQLWVSPSGSGYEFSEKHPGSLEGTYLRYKILELRGNGEHSIQVILKEGVYALNTPVGVSGAMAGNSADTLAFIGIAADPSNGKAMISGGKQVTGWQDAGNGIYKALLPEGANFRQLYVDGKMAIRARHPNRDNDTNYGPYWKVKSFYNSDNTKMVVAASDVQPLNDLSGVEMVIHQDWMHNRAKVNSTTLSGENAIVTISLGLATWGTTNLPYFWENSLDFLDAEGEWYFDKTTRYLYYKPRTTEDISQVEISYPSMNRLFTLMGSETTPVQNVYLQNIEFKYGNWTQPGINGARFNQGVVAMEGDIHAESMIWVSHARNVRIANCDISGAGGNAIVFDVGVKNSEITACHFDQLAANAILMDANKVVRTEDLHSAGNQIKNNLFENFGMNYTNGYSLFAGSVSNLTVAQNEIRYARFSGMQIGNAIPSDIMHDNLISANNIHDVMWLHNDGGGVYTTATMPGSQITYNWIHDMARGPWVGGSPAAAIFLDDHSAWITVANNVLQTELIGVRQQSDVGADRNAHDNTLTNNDAADPATIANSGVQLPTGVVEHTVPFDDGEIYYVHTKNEGIVQIADSQVDSVKVEGESPTLLNFYKENDVVYTNTLANVDSVKFTVDAPPIISIAYPTGIPHAPGVVEGEDFDYGGEGVAYHDTDGTNTDVGIYRTDPEDQGVDITNDTYVPYSNRFAVVGTEPGEWMNYTIDAPEAAEYAFSFGIMMLADVATSINLVIDGETIDQITVPNTNWAVAKIVGPKVNLSAGTHVVTIQFNGSMVFDYFKFVSFNDIVPVGDLLDATGWTANANSNVTDVPPSAVLDRDESTFWFGADDNWQIVLDMLTNKEVQTVGVAQLPTEVWIKTAKISFSTDGTTWTAGEYLTYPEKSPAFARGNLVLATPVTARYVKIERVEGFDPTPHLALITEIYVYGRELETPPDDGSLDPTGWGVNVNSLVQGSGYEAIDRNESTFWFGNDPNWKIELDMLSNKEVNKISVLQHSSEVWIKKAQISFSTNGTTWTVAGVVEYPEKSPAFARGDLVLETPVIARYLKIERVEGFDPSPNLVLMTEVYVYGQEADPTFPVGDLFDVTGWTANANSNVTGVPPSAVIDRDESTFWFGNDPNWKVELDMLSNKEVQSISVLQLPAEVWIKTAKISFSTDGTTWTAGENLNYLEKSPAAARGDLVLANPVTARYVRIERVEGFEPSPTLALITEIYVYGQEIGTPPDDDLLDTTGWTANANTSVNGDLGGATIDRDESTFWFGNDPDWKVELDMKSNKEVRKISVLQLPTEVWIKTAKISFSTDGTTWAPAGLVEYPEKSAAFARGDLVLATPVTARYVRIERVEGFDPSPTLVLMTEVYIYGQEAGTPPDDDLLDTTGWTANANTSVNGDLGGATIDRDESTFWFGNDANWKVELDMQSNKEVRKISVLQLPTEVWIKTAKISFSTDGTTWTAGENLNYLEKSAAAARGDLVLATPVTARYIRIERVEGFDPSPTLALITEIYVYGQEIGTPPDDDLLDTTGWTANANTSVNGDLGGATIDRDESTFWFGNDPDWKVELDMLSNKEVRKISVLQLPTEVWIKTAKISFSTDGTTWTPAGLVEYPEKSPAFARGDLVFATPVTARYVRIERVEGFDPSPTLVLMTEVYIYGQEAGPTLPDLLDTTGWTANANSNVTGVPPSAVLDRDESTFWFGNDPDWKVELDMLSNKEVHSISVLQLPAEVWIKTAKISFSTDGTTWTAGENLNFLEKSAAAARGDLVLAAPVTARYVRIERVEGFDPSPTLALITEIYVYGHD